MPTYRITEPHPSHPSSNIYHSGRGGAGNITRLSSNQVTPGASASGPASRVKLSPPPSTALFTSGRGGAGNIHQEKERAMFSFDEELILQERMRERAAPVYHIGRGGAGNAIDEFQTRTQRQNSASSSGSVDEERGDGVRRSIEGAWQRVSKQFSR